MAAPVWESVTTGTQASGSTTVDVTKPAGTVEGDLVVVHIAYNSISSSPSSTGFTSRSQVTETIEAESNRPALSAVLTMPAGPSEPASWTFNIPNNGNVTWQAHRVSGGAFDAVTVAEEEPAGTDLDAPTVTASQDDSLHMLLAMGYPKANAPQWTPPAGYTERSDFGDGLSGYYPTTSATVGVAAGATGVKTFTIANSSTYGAAHSLIIKPANTAPNAPTGLTPDGGTSIDRALTNRFSWTFSDPDAGDSQSKYDLRYRVAGTSPWTDVSESTPNQFRDIIGGTFTADDWEWQVRTYDAQGVVGPYSASAFFTAADQPTVPTITDPVNDQTIGADSHDVVWSTPDQTAFRLRTVADLAGSPDTGTVYTDTDTVESTTARTRTVAFAVNNRTEHVQVRIRFDGLWSDWASVKVNIAFTPPATPTAVLAVHATGVYLDITATHPTPGGGEPTVTHHDIYRRDVGDSGDGLRIAANVAPSGTHTDGKKLAHRQDVAYRVRAVGDNGVSSYGAWTASTGGGLAPSSTLAPSATLEPSAG